MWRLPSAGTAQSVVQMMTGYWASRAIYAAAKLSLADLVEAGGSQGVHYESLAKDSKSHPSSIYRLMRALASVNVFKEEKEGYFSQTDLSAHLATSHPQSLRHAALMYGEETHTAWTELPTVLQTGQSSWKQVFGKDHFEFYEATPASYHTFNKAMGELGRTMYSDQGIVKRIDLPQEGSPVVIDVGGGYGSLLASVLDANPAAKGVLYDLGTVVENARGVHGDKYGDRLTIESGNFFKQVPAGGDVYMMKRILHDWNDDQCIEILLNCAAVMGPSSRLLILETVIPQGNEPYFGKWLDLHMMVITGGQERTAEQFSRLFERAGLYLVGVTETETPIRIVEARKK
eukprot:TRINITY_DN9966_c0_g1_i2.p1 TRINITY_DN9966_c0_g1~~TRINITY_DN9966_c0_g1_i2.p1  ORF type:complete len:345 (+),score=70.08 TRINITY_DN9966_c0_g1_i2:80-1114(+)